MEDFDPNKSIDDYEFSNILIWARVYKLPLGHMSQYNREAIGDQIGECMELDGVEEGMAMGQCLHVKVPLDISKPLMRGVIVVVNDEGRTKWCPIEYEFLPDFCFICGVIGHLDKECSTRLKKGEDEQFGKFLRWLPPKKFGQYGRRGWNERGEEISILGR